MKRDRENSRTMCAELLTIRWKDGAKSRSEVASLEDISAAGACVRLDESIEPETEVSLHYPNGKYRGRVKHCTYEDYGYLVGIAFEDGYRWSKADFQPTHLLEFPQKTH